MEYILSIYTNDPDEADIYYPNSSPSVGELMCDPVNIKASMLRNVKRQANTIIERVLSHQYVETSPDHATHYVDMDAVWKYVDSSRTSLQKKIYCAYKHDFEGYQRYLAVLSPVS